MEITEFENTYLDRMRQAVRTFGTREEAAKFVISLSGEEITDELIGAVQGIPLGDYPANSNRVQKLAYLATKEDVEAKAKYSLASDYMWSQYDGRFNGSPTPMLCWQAEDEYRRELLTRLASGISSLAAKQ